jgi:diguanylate cyclase (GGDEF)-like protein
METKKSIVLIVEDDPIQLRLISGIMDRHYDLRVSLTAAKALTIIDSSVDLILLDINLVDMDGLELCQHIKDNPETEKIPIIFITATQDVALEERGIASGAVDFITKPFSASVLLARVKSHIENKHYRDLLETMALKDGLTNIANRRHYETVFLHEWNRLLRAQKPLSLLILDIDHFKQVNDIYGHHTGDAALKVIASILENFCKRPCDFVARIGGEEFALLLPETDFPGAHFIAQAICDAIAATEFYTEERVRCPLTASLGVNTIIPKSLDGKEAFKQEADKQLYQAKQNGRNQVMPEFFYSDNTVVIKANSG